MECLECFDSLDLEILKIGWACENKSDIVAPIITKHANIFCKTYFN